MEAPTAVVGQSWKAAVKASQEIPPSAVKWVPSPLFVISALCKEGLGDGGKGLASPRHMGPVWLQWLPGY